MPDSLMSASRYPFASHAFHDNAPIFFYHTANIKEGTLTIQVLGPNLTFTFRHDKSLPKSRLSSTALLKKTVGFVAIAGFNPREGHRIIAWAQSGHGLGEGGDPLIAGNGALSNRVWARRTRKLAEVLGLRSSHPFDKTSIRGEDARGSFLSAHVEAKLATHAIFTLLKIFNIEHDRANITKTVLRRLASMRFPSGEKPVIEVYFSRKNCNHCEQYLSRLQTITGVTIRPIWRHRLMRMEFTNERIPDSPDGNARGKLAVRQAEGEDDDDLMVVEHVEINAPIVIPDEEAEGQIVIIDDEGEEEEDVIVLGDDELEEDDVIEVTPDGLDVIHLRNRLGFVELTSAMPTIPTTHTPPSATARERVDNAARLHYFLAGVGATIGQRPFRPQAARAAAVDLALFIRRQRQRKKAAKNARRRATATAAARFPTMHLATRPLHQGQVVAQSLREQPRTTMPRLAQEPASQPMPARSASFPQSSLQLRGYDRQDTSLPKPNPSFNRPLGQNSQDSNLSTPPSSQPNRIQPGWTPDRARSRSSSPTIVPDFWRAPSAREAVMGRSPVESPATLPAFLRSPAGGPQQGLDAERRTRARRQRC